MKMSKKHILNSAAPRQTVKRIVIPDRFAFIARNWQKHRIPIPGYFSGPGPDRKKPTNGRGHVAAE